uniref:Immunoglobulin V-set domain-containing protein n=1 Tax=Acanthochromis polyacanthus TaxID=80966 RepID=A0A3Q1F8E3_9TELE
MPWLCCLLCVVFLVFSTGSSLSDRVSQTPDHICKTPGEEAQINCSHSIEGYDRILWYKQMRNSPLQFLGYAYMAVASPEPGLDVKIEGSTSKDQTCTLTVKALSPNSSAVYFCAKVGLNSMQKKKFEQESLYLFSTTTTTTKRRLLKTFEVDVIFAAEELL